MFERLKTSRRLQIEIALAGLALWQLKRERDRRLEAIHGLSPAPPVTENLEGSTLYVWPTAFDEHGEPWGLEVGSVQQGEPVFSVQGVLKKTREFIADSSSENSRKRLRSLKKQLKAARSSVIKRAG